MPRKIRVAAAEMGPLSDSDPRARTVDRLIDSMEAVASRHVDLVVLPEMALTSFSSCPHRRQG